MLDVRWVFVVVRWLIVSWIKQRIKLENNTMKEFTKIIINIKKWNHYFCHFERLMGTDSDVLGNKNSRETFVLISFVDIYKPNTPELKFRFENLNSNESHMTWKQSLQNVFDLKNSVFHNEEEEIKRRIVSLLRV